VMQNVFLNVRKPFAAVSINFKKRCEPSLKLRLTERIFRGGF